MDVWYFSIRVLGTKVRNETKMKFYKTTAAPSLVVWQRNLESEQSEIHGNEIPQKLNGCSRFSHIRNQGIRDELQRTLYRQDSGLSNQVARARVKNALISTPRVNSQIHTTRQKMCGAAVEKTAGGLKTDNISDLHPELEMINGNDGHL